LRLVLDTNVWLDWLVFRDPRVEHLRDHARFQVLLSRPCEDELVRVLAYDLGRFSLDPAGQAAALAEARRVSRRMDAPIPADARLPRCRDADDQIFLEAALAGGADCLVTRDRALLDCARRTLPFRILPPEALG